MALAAVLMVGSAVSAEAQGNTPACEHLYSAGEFRPFASTVWQKDRWQRGQPKQSTLTAGEQMRACAASPSHRLAMRRYWKRQKKAYTRWRLYRQITPYPGYSGREWLTWLPIPKYVTDCESGGSWSAYNSSGASGPFQLLGWGAPMPADSWHKKMTHIRIAADLWSGGSGAANWVCA